MPRRRMTDSELRALLEQHIQKTDFFDNSEVQDNMARALDSYLGRNETKDAPGFESMRSEDVADLVEAITADVLPAFQYDEIAAFEPMGPADTTQAAIESKICNQFILDFNDGELNLQSAIKDALLLRNGIIKVYPQESVTVNRERYTGLTDLELEDVQRRTAKLQTVEVTSIEVNADDPELTDLNLTRTTTYRTLEVAAVDPCNFLIEKEHTSPDPSSAITVGERRFMTRSDLIDAGYNRKLVESLPVTTTDTRLASLARNRNSYQPQYDYHAKALDRIEVFELYVLMDYEGTGVAERRRVIYAGGTSGGRVLSNEPHELVPYAVGVPFLYPHRFQGISVFDKLEELERQKSRALSQFVRNMHNANFPELIVEDGSVAEQDYTTRRSSGVIRADRVDAVRELPVTDISSGSITFLNYLDKVRDERAGASLSMQAAGPQMASDSAYATERMTAPREKLATLICNTLGATLVKQLFRLVHRNLRQFFPGEQNFHVGGGDFISLDPATWPARHKVRVIAGMSNAERQQKRAALEAHLLQQEKLFESGQEGILMDLSTYYEALIAWSKTSGLSTPRRFWIDPRSQGAQERQQQNTQAAEQERVRQERLQGLLYTTQLRVADMDRRADLYKHMTDLAQKYWSDTLNSEMEELRVQAQGSTDARPDPDEIDVDQDTGRERAQMEETP